MVRLLGGLRAGTSALRVRLKKCEMLTWNLHKTSSVESVVF